MTAILRVTQIRSAIRRQKNQRDTLISLGLNKRHRTRQYPDTPALRGRLNTVKHLITVTESDSEKGRE